MPTHLLWDHAGILLLLSSDHDVYYNSTLAVVENKNTYSALMT